MIGKLILEGRIDLFAHTQPLFLLLSFRWLYTRMFVIDGNFTAVHLRQKHPENDVWLTDGTGYMTQRVPYQEHLKVARNRTEVCIHAVNTRVNC
jgi:hypothetical protein